MNKAEMNKTVAELKNQQQDFEFYPTTTEIGNALIDDLSTVLAEPYGWKTPATILDVCAGDGEFLKYLTDNLNHKIDLAKNKSCEQNSFEYNFRNKKFSGYGVEKSSMLRALWRNKDIAFLGADFFDFDLMSHTHGVIFCNPPYSQYADWMNKVILEANAKVAYFVVPTRWKENSTITQTLALRQVKAEIIGQFDFAEADRPARAVTDLVRVDLTKEHYNLDSMRAERLKARFDNAFPNLAKKTQLHYNEETTQSSDVRSPKYSIEQAIADYTNEHQQFVNAFQALDLMPAVIFKELDISIYDLRKAIEEKLNGLKATYWQQLFKQYEPIQSRLTSYILEKFRHQFKNYTQIEFNFANIMAITEFFITFTQEHYEDIFIGFFYDLSGTRFANFKQYKSNQRVFDEDKWRYNRDKFKQDLKATKGHYLGYRIILNFHHFIDGYQQNTISDSARNFLSDAIKVAKHLGFNTDYSSISLNQTYGELERISFLDSDGEFKPLVEYRPYKNGNLHVKFNSAFLLALNVKVGQLLGWVHSKEDVKREMFDEADISKKKFDAELDRVYNMGDEMFLEQAPKMLLLN